MQPLIRLEVDGRVACIAHSTRADGDLSPSTVAADELCQRRRNALDLPWFAVRQVHSDRVVSVSEATPGERPVADALVTDRSGIALAVHAGDCVPVGFISSSGAVAASHAGWKGLEVGVLESTVRALRRIGSASTIIAAVGPHIRADRYEFGDADLDRLVRRFGPAVASRTRSGEPALDLTAAVAAECARLGAEVRVVSPACTAAEESHYWSHRARGERGRLALVAWLEDTSDG